ncbi:MAG TPA: protein kinase [Blastocatellia bacterium]|nr:protein kinase [Blastocatellia bacterium]
MAASNNKNDQTQDYGSDQLTVAEIPDPVEGMHPGVVLKGRYVIEKEIGRGGIGVVYLAHDRQLHSRPVVIKVLLADVDENAWISRKFRTEIEALARLNHPNIVAALDAGELANGKPYLVMQYAEGVDLRALIEPEGMEFGKVARIMRQIGQALTAAHEKGIIHCDLKPENIIVQQLDENEELVRILDFGISRIKDPQVTAAQQTTRVIGTVAYMASEQLEGRPTFSSDIYAAGVVAYEMVTGLRPFNPVTQFKLLDAQRQGVEKKPKELRPDLPEAAQAEILKALSFNAADRHQRARDFTEALARALTGQAGAAEGVTVAAANKLTTEQVSAQGTNKLTAGSTQRVSPESAPAPKREKRLSAPLIAGIAILLVVVALGAIFWPRPESKRVDPPPPPPVAERLLNYHLIVQKYNESEQPIGEPFKDTGRTIFEYKYRVRLAVSSPQSGYFYLINEGPLPSGGFSYNVLYPKMTRDGGSAQVAANQQIFIPGDSEIIFDESEGVEKLWLVWAAEPVAEMEQVKKWANPQDRGVIKDAGQVEMVRQFLARHSANEPEKKEDMTRQEVDLKGAGDILVTVIPLQHR